MKFKGPNKIQEAAGVEPKTRFVFDFQATRRHHARHREIELTPAQMEMARKAGEAFGLRPRAFLRRMLDSNLPGQPGSAQSMADLLRAEHIAFVCLDEGLLKRIERAAQSVEMTVDEYVADAVRQNVDCDEQHLIVHPTTGQLLCDERDLYKQVASATGEAAEELAAARSYGVSQTTLEAAARYAAKHGRTVEEFIANAIELAASDDPLGESKLRGYPPRSASLDLASLDDRCCQLLSAHLAENPEADARDVINGAVDFLLGDPESHDPVLGGSFDANECVSSAKQRRLGQEATGKHHLAFSVWLTEEQMRGKYNLVASIPPGGENELYFSATVPKDGNPLLTVDGEPVESFAQAVQRAESRHGALHEALHEQEPVNAPTRSRRHAKTNRADVALLAAADPESAEEDALPAGEEPPRVELDGEQMPDYEADSQDGEEAQ